ncbi:50S ribosomal protein L13 [Candidatus Gracilibacteria bacterium]|nr:MAG: 50S ribosomal protein L13 [Candidatus Gracilibacteria bacterium]PIE85056.1 MAG: 50S ribosomal protein L13 [Candidatus Gracilibacteria bacterium]
MKTFTPSQISGGERKWYIIDAKGQNLGRLATKISVLLKGKDRVDFVPYIDNGANVIVINSDKFEVTGNKMEDKIYYRHTGYLGGLKETSLGELLRKKPTKPLELAVSGMLPKNKLRSKMISRLKLFTGEEHSYVAQKPELIK